MPQAGLDRYGPGIPRKFKLSHYQDSASTEVGPPLA